MSLAFVFPGQGSQQVGMGKALYDASPAAKAIFDEADDALGSKLSALCFEGPDTDLVLTANTQPAILTTSVAALAALRERGYDTPSFVLGHSLGEFSALVAAGALAFADAVRLVRLRGQAMQDAVPAGTGIDDTAFNIATGRQTNVLELAELVGKVMRQKPVIEMAPARPGELFRSSLDITKAGKMLGWKPQVGFDEGLPQLVEWFRKEGR